MRLAMIATVLALAPTAGFAQSTLADKSRQQAATEMQGLVGTAEARINGAPSTDQFECLFDKRIRKNVCHTRYEWKRIAAEIDRRNARH